MGTTVIQANQEIRTAHGLASEAAIASVAAPPAITAVKVDEVSFPGDKTMGISISSRSITVTARYASDDLSNRCQRLLISCDKRDPELVFVTLGTDATRPRYHRGFAI